MIKVLLQVGRLDWVDRARCESEAIGHQVVGGEVIGSQEKVLCLCPTGDDAEASEAECTHAGGGCKSCPIVADTGMTKVGRGSDSRMKDALMKLEPEVVVAPEERCRIRHYLGQAWIPGEEQTEPWSLDLCYQIRETRREQKQRKRRIFVPSIAGLNWLPRQTTFTGTAGQTVFTLNAWRSFQETGSRHVGA